MAKYRLVCMDFEGEIQWLRPLFDDVYSAWRYDSDMGSLWYFYPFHFVTTESRMTIAGTPDELQIFQGKRLKTIRRFFGKVSKSKEAQNLGINDYSRLLIEQYRGPFNLGLKPRETEKDPKASIKILGKKLLQEIRNALENTRV